MLQQIKFYLVMTLRNYLTKLELGNSQLTNVVGKSRKLPISVMSLESPLHLL